MNKPVQESAIPAHNPAVGAQDPVAELTAAIDATRAEAGRLLACFRHAAGLSQARLADQIGYSATVVAHAERGRRPVSAEFWEVADDALAADGNLTTQGTRIKELARSKREEQRRLDKARHAMRLARFLPQARAGGRTAATPDAPVLAITVSGVGRCPHCHQPVTLLTEIAAPADTSAEPRLLRNPVPKSPPPGRDSESLD
jgi:transcriptional regulator with XRE-family HTH domain